MGEILEPRLYSFSEAAREISCHRTVVAFAVTQLGIRVKTIRHNRKAKGLDASDLKRIKIFLARDRLRAI